MRTARLNLRIDSVVRRKWKSDVLEVGLGATERRGTGKLDALENQCKELLMVDQMFKESYLRNRNEKNSQ